MSDWNGYGNDYGSTDTAGYGRESEEGLRDRARHGVERLRHSAGDVGERARSGFESYFEEHPLLVGAGVFALGIAVGMMLPSSRQEERWMGDASHRVRERAREAAGKLGDAARHSLEEARDTAREELRSRGLDAQTVKENTRDAVNEARDVASKAAQEARRTAEEDIKGKQG